MTSAYSNAQEVSIRSFKACRDCGTHVEIHDVENVKLSHVNLSD